MANAFYHRKKTENPAGTTEKRNMRNGINELFDTLDLLVVRMTLFILLVVGAYTLIKGHV